MSTAAALKRGMAGGLVALAAALALGGCASTPPRSFATAQAAVDAMVSALRADDAKEMRTILGSEGQELLRSGDSVADEQSKEQFLALYDEKHALIQKDDVATLTVGATEWPLPIPIVKDDDGWWFDVWAGADEVLNRRIGRNELSAMQVCLAIHDAEREYASRDYDGDGSLAYAQKFRSEPGKKDGLFWHAAPGEPESPLGELAASAAAEGYRASASASRPTAYHGYYYRILTGQGGAAPGGALSYVAHGKMIGGFGVVAWPAEYGSSGLKTFLVSHHGVVYEKDLGDGTDRIARGMKLFDPGAGWVECARSGR